jgi:aminopeptidase C
MKKLAIDVLKSGNPVWFGCDVGKAYIFFLYSLDGQN